MLRKINIITFVLFLVISIYLFLELFGILELITISDNLIVCTYVVLAISELTFLLISFNKAYFKAPQIVEKIIYRDAEKTNIEEVEQQKETDEEIIERAVELTNKIMADIKDLDDFETYCDKMLINISKNFNIVQGIFYVLDKSTNIFKTKGTYAYYSEEIFREFELGVGLTGQVAKNKKFLSVNNVPPQYLKVLSGLGSSSPCFLTLLPIINEDTTIAVIELASFEKLSDDLEKLFMHVSLEIGSDLNRFLQ